MEERKYHQEYMWCFNCEHEWLAEDYHNTNACPNCTTEPVQIYRTSGTAFIYAHIRKHPEKYPGLNNYNKPKE
jgi:Zn finger protein HypA/HybF involved in hydrogenase expression